MINIKNILIIIKKELRAYFNSPTAYIVLITFLILWEFLFFRSVFQIGQASLQMLFLFLPWLLLLLIPSLTMASFSEEKNQGTLEFLLTHPLKDLELLLGKFFSIFIFTQITFAFILPIALSLNSFGNLDFGIIFGQYLACSFLASILIALGIFISSLLKSQVASLLLTIVASFFLIAVGFELITYNLPLFLAPILENFSALSHFESMARGVLDIRDIWYFVSANIIFLFATYLVLFRRKLSSRSLILRKHKINLAIIIVIFTASNLLSSYIPGRIDLTQNRIYTLSPATKAVLNNLEPQVNIILFVSNKLPPDFQPIMRRTKDLLRDYKVLGKGKVLIKQQNPQSDPEILTRAQEFGIQEVRFDIVSQEERQIKNGFFGLTVSVEEDYESIPFIQDTADLEYKLTSFIKKLTTSEKKKIVFLSGHGEKNLSTDLRILNQELEKQFKVEEILINDENLSAIPEDAKALVIAGPNQEIDSKNRAAISDFIEKGGAVLFLIDAVLINPEAMQAIPNEQSFSEFLVEYGVEVKKDIVYDLRSNETVRFGGGMFNMLLAYPLWPKVGPAEKDSILTSKIESLILSWASSINLDEDKIEQKGFKLEKLLATTKYGGKQFVQKESIEGQEEIEFFSLDPQQRFSQQNLGQQITAVSLTQTKEAGKDARLIVVGDSDFLSDQFLNYSPENLGFGIEVVSFLAQEESLAEIQLKQIAKRNLVFENQTQVMMIKYGNMALAFVLPFVFGSFWLIRRRGLRRFNYDSRM